MVKYYIINHVEDDPMPSLFNVLVCILALLIGILIGEKYRKWKKEREKKNSDKKESDAKDSDQKDKK